MKQLRETDKGQKLLNQKVIDLSDVIENIHNDDVPSFVRLLDEAAEDWDVTKQCFDYFLKQMILGIGDTAWEDDEFMTKDVKRFARLINLKLLKQ